MLAQSAFADKKINSDILIIDKPMVTVEDLYFPDTEHIQPDESDFQIVNYLLLSSYSGQRMATVTIKNTSTGQRILSSNDILAIFANGDKKAPFTINQKFSGKEIISLNLNFGLSDFPVLTIYTNN